MINYSDIKQKLINSGIDSEEIEKEYNDKLEEVSKEFIDIDESNKKIKATRRLLKYYRNILSQIKNSDEIEGTIIGIDNFVDFNDIARKKSNNGLFPDGWMDAGKPIPPEPNFNLTCIFWDGMATNRLKMTHKKCKEYVDKVGDKYVLNYDKLLNRNVKGRGFKQEKNGVLVYMPLNISINGKADNPWENIKTEGVHEIQALGDNEIVAIHAEVNRVNMSKNQNLIVELNESFEDRQELNGDKVVGISKNIKIPDTAEPIKVVGRLFRTEDKETGELVLWIDILGCDKAIVNMKPLDERTIEM